MRTTEDQSTKQNQWTRDKTRPQWDHRNESPADVSALWLSAGNFPGVLAPAGRERKKQRKTQLIYSQGTFKIDLGATQAGPKGQSLQLDELWAQFNNWKS